MLRAESLRYDENVSGALGIAFGSFACNARLSNLFLLFGLFLFLENKRKHSPVAASSASCHKTEVWRTTTGCSDRSSNLSIHCDMPVYLTSCRPPSLALSPKHHSVLEQFRKGRICQK